MYILIIWTVYRSPFLKMKTMLYNRLKEKNFLKSKKISRNSMKKRLIPFLKDKDK